MRIKDSLALFVLASSFNLGARAYCECAGNVQTGIHLRFGCRDGRMGTLAYTLGHPDWIWVPWRVNMTDGMHVRASSRQVGVGSDTDGYRRWRA
jgi:hypothetical protein